MGLTWRSVNVGQLDAAFAAGEEVTLRGPQGQEPGQGPLRRAEGAGRRRVDQKAEDLGPSLQRLGAGKNPNRPVARPTCWHVDRPSRARDASDGSGDACGADARRGQTTSEGRAGATAAAEGSARSTAADAGQRSWRPDAVATR